MASLADDIEWNETALNVAVNLRKVHGGITAVEALVLVVRCLHANLPAGDAPYFGNADVEKVYQMVTANRGKVV